MSTGKLPPPLPTLHSSGALTASTKECPWWPEPSAIAEAINAIESGTRQRSGMSTVEPGQAGVNALNRQWIEAARHHLLNYVLPATVTSGSSRRTMSAGNTGIVSAALTRMRDDNVVFQSLPIDETTMRGLERDHRDVLAAVALLSRVDERSGQPAFHDGEFEPA